MCDYAGMIVDALHVNCVMLAVARTRAMYDAPNGCIMIRTVREIDKEGGFPALCGYMGIRACNGDMIFN